MAANGVGVGPSARIVAIEEEEEEDFIPGPPASSPSYRERQHSGGSGGSGGKQRGSLFSRVLSISGKRSGPSPQQHANDELQLSGTDHHEYVAGSGILASREDLNMAPEAFAAGCNLLQAAARGDIPAVKLLLESRRTQINFRDYDRRTALHVAASEGHLSVCKFLIEECGAAVNRSDRWGGSPLDDAHRHRHRSVVEYLRKVGAATGSGNRLTNLIKAAADGDLDEVKTLLKVFQKNMVNTKTSSAGPTFNVNEGDYDKRTALHLAAGEGHLKVVEALVNAGADPNVEDRWNRRPLDDARTGKHKDIVEFLQKHGGFPGKAVRDDTDRSLSHSGRRATDNMRVDFDELEMIDRIGSGAFGEIYKCRWRGTLVAAKIIKTAKIRKEWTNRRVAQAIADGKDVDDAIRELDEADLLEGDEDDAVADFRQEISVLKSLRHPHIVLLLAYSTTENYECLISELMKCSLLDVFKSHLVQGTRMNIRTQITYATQLALGMNYLHTCKPPIIHRDLKPANLLIDHAGTLKISDFGLSKVRPDPGKTDTEVYRMTGETGSYRFMAPEVYRHSDYNETVDIYSYAMILFYLLVGRPPWVQLAGLDAVRKAADEGDRPTIPRDLDLRLTTLMKECWDDNPAARPPFSTVIKVLSNFSRESLHVDSNDMITMHDSASGCHCVIQ